MNPTEDAWVAKAIAEQEEHIRRVTSCRDRIGQAHTFRAQTRRGITWSECFRCGTTETGSDYAAKLDAFAR
jgi:hypothetical protein